MMFWYWVNLPKFKESDRLLPVCFQNQKNVEEVAQATAMLMHAEPRRDAIVLGCLQLLDNKALNEESRMNDNGRSGRYE